MSLYENMEDRSFLQNQLYNYQQYRSEFRSGIRDWNKGFATKASYSCMAQYVHLLTATPFSMPTDLWVPITRNIRPMYANQYSAGIYNNGLPGWEFSLEGYCKQMRHVLEYQDTCSVPLNMGSGIVTPHRRYLVTVNDAANEDDHYRLDICNHFLVRYHIYEYLRTKMEII